MNSSEESSGDNPIFMQLKELSSLFRLWRNGHNFQGGFVEATTENGRTYEQQIVNVFSLWATDEERFKMYSGSAPDPGEYPDWSCRWQDQIRLYHNNRLMYEVDGLAFFDDMLVFLEVTISRQPAYFRSLREKIPGKRDALGKIFGCDRVGCLIITRPGMRSIPYRSVEGTISLTLPFMNFEFFSVT